MSVTASLSARPRGSSLATPHPPTPSSKVLGEFNPLKSRILGRRLSVPLASRTLSHGGGNCCDKAASATRKTTGPVGCGGAFASWDAAESGVCALSWYRWGSRDASVRSPPPSSHSSSAHRRAGPLSEPWCCRGGAAVVVLPRQHHHGSTSTAAAQRQHHHGSTITAAAAAPPPPDAALCLSGHARRVRQSRDRGHLADEVLGVKVGTG